jgi:hypothetical protein
MKNFNLSLFLGCCVVSAGVIVGSLIISANLPATPIIPSSMTLSDSMAEFGEYLSDNEAAAFLRIGYEEFPEFVDSGALRGTFTTIEGYRVFSKDKLSEWVNARIED